MVRLTLLLSLLTFVPALASAAEVKAITLPKPQMDGGMSLLRALKERKSTREFSQQAIPLQTLSNLLWAAFGISRPEDGKRTAPSARNWQETDLYVAMADGVYLYDAKAVALQRISADDLRADTGTQPFVKDAPINLIYVADLAKMTGAKPEDQTLYAAVDVGLIVENVYLFCASAGLATVVRGSVNREALAKKLSLRPEQRIIVAQSVGLPAAVPSTAK